MSLYDKQRERRANAVAPYLEPGETVKASFIGQTPVPPWVFFLIASYVFIFIQKYRVVVATERNLYVMQNKFLSSYKFNGVALKVPLASADIEVSKTWMRVEGGPKLYVPPWGPLKRGLTELAGYLQSVRGTGALPSGAHAPAGQQQQSASPPS
jgi:hypothetical protein